MINYTNWEHQQRTIAQGILTNSKHPKSMVFGCYPTHAIRSKGCHIWDNEENKYIDYICGLGTNLLGYGNDKIAQKIQDFLFIGNSPSLPTPYEASLIEDIRTILPMAERVKILKTGSEACSAAVTIARAYTGNSLILSEGYHGWHNEFTQLTDPANGCPHSKNIKKLDSRKNFYGVGAVIIEPVIIEWNDKRRNWLYWLREETKKSGTLLIFDEIITGMRFKDFSVARAMRIEPDMVLLGKALGNGFPISVVCGKKEWMDGNYFVSSTYAGDILSIAAARETIRQLKTNTSYSLEYLWDAGQHFIGEFNMIDSDLIQIKGYPSRGIFMGDPKFLALFMQEMALAGILFCKSWFYNFDLIKHHNEVLGAAKQVIYRIKNGEVKLKGEMPVSPFATKVRSKDGKLK